MSLQCITNLKVDFYDKKYILINAKQLDKDSRFLSVTCYNHGERYNINPILHSAYIRYKKSDNHSVFNFCNINNSGEIIVELTEQMLASNGICYADLVVVNKGDAEVNEETGEIIGINNTGILSTMTFCIDVSEVPVLNSEIEASSEFIKFNEDLETYWADFEDVMKTAKSYAKGNTGIRDGENTDNAKYYYEQSRENATSADESEANALASATAAATSESNALTSENNAAESESNALASAESASASATSASSSENEAKRYATNAQSSKESAAISATNASASATEAYGYLQQTESITNGLNGAFSPKGTIAYAELIELKNNGAVAAGYLYHISDDFTTDENFRVAGKECGAGTSVYYTVDNTFDIFVGATVAGVKGENDAEYRTGMVNITSEDIGAIPRTNLATIDEVKDYLGI